MKIKLILNWNFAGKLAIIFTIVTSLLLFFNWLFKNSGNEKIKATIEINDSHIPKAFFDIESHKNEFENFYEKWDLAIINIKNTGEIEVKELQIDISNKGVFNGIFYGGYFEIEMDKKLLESSFCTNIIKLPPLRGKKEIQVKIWSLFYYPNDININYPNGVIKPTQIIKTKGFYAWTATHLNSWNDFLILILPLYIIIVLIFSYLKYRETDKILNKKPSK